MALAGAAQGFGDSIVEQARAKREEALRAAEREQDRAWQTEDRDLGYSERRAAVQRGFDRDDASMGRAAGAMEGLYGTDLLGLIDTHEGGANYDTLFGHSQNGGKFDGVRISEMTLDELAEFSNPSGEYGQWVGANNPDNSRVATPMGRYQIVGTTMRAVAREMGLPGDTVFTPDVQDSMARHLADKRIARGGNDPAALRREMRAEWDGFKNVSDAALDQAIAQYRAGGNAFAAAVDPSVPADVRQGLGAALTGSSADSPAPVSGEDGQSVTPEREFRPLPTTVDGQLRRDNRLRYGARGEVPDGFDEGDIDEGLLEAVKMEMERLTNEEGMSVDQARESAMSRLMFNTEETRSARDGLFGTGIGARDAETRNGAFTGFSPFGGSDAPAAPVNQPDPAMPPEPPAPPPAPPAPPPRTGLGADPALDTPIPAPRDTASRVVGQLYVSPTGTVARWTGEGWEVVQ